MTHTRNKFKVLLIDDHEVVRFGISQIIRQYVPNCEISEISEFHEINQIENLSKMNLVISDLNLPDFKFYQVVEELKLKFNEIPIIIFSMYEEETILPILSDNQNIYKFIHKGEGLFKLKDSVLEIYQGNLHHSRSSKISNTDNKFSLLSNREMEIAILLISGKTGVEIQELTQLKATTISTLKHRIFQKLDIHSIAELMKLSLMYGIDQS